ncbi:MAG: DegV family protein [Dehalococcoidia bacterium]|nr:DegV family protein [Dehalococcoidia bacterium]
MTIHIVTDSGSDLPRDVAEDLGISIVPLYVHFGSVSYRDGIDIQPGEFFQKLVDGPIHPTTSSASPGDFAQVYEKLGKDSEGIISVHLSSKVSATYDSALQGKELISNKRCPIEVVDSRLVTIPLALVAVAAARAAAAGKNMDEIRDYINRLIPVVRAYGILDTLKYIVKGGRLGKASGILGSLLPVRPILTIKEGTITPVGAARTRSGAIAGLHERLKSISHNVEAVGIAHSSQDDELASFVDKLKAFMPDIKPMIAKLGPAIGTHGGPGTILVGVQHSLIKTEADTESKRRKFGTLPSMQSIKEGILQRKQRNADVFSLYKPVPAIQ